MYTSIFKGRSQRQQQRRKRTKFNVFCEQLEGRQLLSAGTIPVTVGPIDLTYGQTLNQVVNGGLTPAKVNINGSDVPGTWTFASASDPTNDLTQAVLDAGSHTTDLTATFTPAGTSDTYTTAAVDVEVAKAKIVIVTDSYERTYGNANPTLTDTLYADLGPATGTDPNTGKDYSTEIDPNTGKPYEVYEQLDSTDLASVAYTDALGGAAAASTDAGQLSHIGSYDTNPAQISDAGAGTASHEFLNNFDVSYYGGTLTVDQATVTTLGAFGPVHMTYGQTLDQVVNGGITPAEVNINGNDVQGTWTFAAVSDPTKDLTQAVLDAGSHTTDLTATFHPFDTADWGDNYTAASADVEVAKAKIAIEADSYKRIYGDANPTLTDTLYADLGPATGIDPNTGKDYSTEIDPKTGKPYEVYEQLDSTDLASVAYTDALGGDAAASTDAGPLSHVGSYDINPTQISDAGTASHEFVNNFDVTYTNGTLTVTPAGLTVTADAQTKTYGEPDPTLSYQITSGNLVGSDSLSGALSRDSGENVGNYAINQDSLSAGDNYNLIYVGANLTITQRDITITGLSGTSRVYNGGTDDSISGTASLNGVVGSDQVTLNNGTASFLDPNAGTGKTVVFSGFTLSGSDSGNYSLSQPANSTANITPAPLTITANNVTKTYGDTVVFTGTEFSTSGLVNSDSIGSVSLASDGAAATAHVSGSPYAITASDAVAGTGTQLSNYAISYVNGSLTVTPRALIVTANNTTMVLGGPVPTLSAYYVGFVNGDSVSNLGGSLRFNPGDTSHAGTTTIGLSGTLTDSDYTIEYNPGTLTVAVPTTPIIIGLPRSKTRL